MPLSRNQSKSAENLRCQRNLLMYFQFTRSVLRYLIVKITNKFVGINTPRMRPRLHSVSDGVYRHFCCWSIEELKHYVYLSKCKETGFCMESCERKEVSVLWLSPTQKNALYQHREWHTDFFWKASRGRTSRSVPAVTRRRLLHSLCYRNLWTSVFVCECMYYYSCWKRNEIMTTYTRF